MLIADTKKSVLRTIAEMDLDKINMDLVENLLEWIVDGPHDYPPGTNPAEPRSSPLSSWIAALTFWLSPGQAPFWCFCRAWLRSRCCTSSSCATGSSTTEAPKGGFGSCRTLKERYQTSPDSGRLLSSDVRSTRSTPPCPTRSSRRCSADRQRASPKLSSPPTSQRRP